MPRKKRSSENYEYKKNSITFGSEREDDINRSPVRRRFAEVLYMKANHPRLVCLTSLLQTVHRQIKNKCDPEKHSMSDNCNPIPDSRSIFRRPSSPAPKQCGCGHASVLNRRLCSKSKLSDRDKNTLCKCDTLRRGRKSMSTYVECQ